MTSPLTLWYSLSQRREEREREGGDGTEREREGGDGREREGERARASLAALAGANARRLTSCSLLSMLRAQVFNSNQDLNVT